MTNHLSTEKITDDMQRMLKELKECVLSEDFQESMTNAFDRGENRIELDKVYYMPRTDINGKLPFDEMYAVSNSNSTAAMFLGCDPTEKLQLDHTVLDLFNDWLYREQSVRCELELKHMSPKFRGVDNRLNHATRIVLVIVWDQDDFPGRPSDWELVRDRAMAW